MKTSCKSIISLIFSSTILSKLFLKIFRLLAARTHIGDLCLKEGFLPVPVHFHSPIPDLADLEKRKIWDVRSDLCGIDFRPEAQTEFLRKLGKKYGGECKWPLHPESSPKDFYVENPSFSFGCAASTHCMIRHYTPDLVIEIGSGMSSMVISGALEATRRVTGKKGKYMVVDPFPGTPIKKDLADSIELVEKRVEMLNPNFFDQLKENDILFIDSGHSVKIGGDVNFLYLDILPRLAPGTVVHIHDINLPYEYPKAYATSETFRQFWTEQYLLQAFLCFNKQYEILLAMSYLMRDHADEFAKAFSFFDSNIHRFTSGSFWIRRKN